MRMIRGYCEAMYALRDEGKVDVKQLVALDDSAMKATDAGDGAKELEFNKRAFELASKLLEESYAENLARAQASASQEERTEIDKITGEFKRCLASGDLYSASRWYRGILPFGAKK